MKRAGFSMVEMMGVALLIGILTAAIGWSVAGMSQNNKIKVAEQRLDVFAAALKSYYVDHLDFPANNKIGDLAKPSSSGLPYIEALPEDPFSAGSPLLYDKAKGIVWSVGPDGVDNNGNATTDIVRRFKN